MGTTLQTSPIIGLELARTRIQDNAQQRHRRNLPPVVSAEERASRGVSARASRALHTLTGMTKLRTAAS
jgi:hypothetical protein